MRLTKKQKEKVETDLDLAKTLINLLNKYCSHGYAKTINKKLYHCISGQELLSIAKHLKFGKETTK